MSTIDTPVSPQTAQDGEVVAETTRLYSYWRIKTFYSMYLGYAFYYLTRKSFPFLIPHLSSLGYSLTDLGWVSTIMAFTYGISKFISGMISDRSNPRYFMAFGLIMTGLLNIAIGASSALWLFAIFWGLNGIFQGWGWPPCSKLLTHWYSQSERGRWWGVWNSSHNVGGALAPIIVAALATSPLGWRFAMFVPAIMSITAGIFLINRLRDTPEKLGFPPIEEFRNESSSQEKKVEETKSLTMVESLFQYVLVNKYIWILAASYFFVYVMRQGINDWMFMYFMKEKGIDQILASTGIAGFEIGGIFGALSAGWLSDTVFPGRRGMVNSLFCAAVGLNLLAIYALPPGNALLGVVLMTTAGFLIFGPQMLIGIAAAELSHKKAAGTSTGFVGLFAYLGSAVAGGPFGYICQHWGWDWYLLVTGACSVISALILSSLWSIRSGNTASKAA